VLDAKEPGDLAWFRRVERVAKARKADFFPIWLTCKKEEIRRRKNPRPQGTAQGHRFDEYFQLFG
jgi:hypothetical protein